MKKKVLHTITRLVVGGAQENTILTAVLLDKEKYDVDVITGNQTGAEGSLFDEAEQRDVNIIKFKNLVREINPFKDLVHLIEMIKFLNKNQYDIIHTHSSKAGIIHRIAAKIAGTPIIVHSVHGWSFHDEMPKWLKTIYVILEKFVARLTDKMITVTDLDIEKGLRENIGFREQYKTIHSSIEVEKYENPNRSVEEIRKEFNFTKNDFIIGTVARLSEQKAPLDFMKVAKNVCEKYPNVKFLYVGGGPLKSEVESYILDNDLEKNVILAGLRKDVPDMLAIMDIFILTSLWEGLPRVFSQAMAAKLPIIATRVAGAPEAIAEDKNGYMTTPGKPQEIVEKIDELINNPEKRKEFGEFGYKVAHKEFSVYSMVKDIDEVYRTIKY